MPIERLHPLLQQTVREVLGYKRLTLVQERVLEYFSKIPSDIKRSSVRHLLIIAPVGSGKTYAALLPIISRILYRRDRETINGVKILYITPLRALNRDLFKRLLNLFNHLNLSIGVWHGDTGYSERRRLRDKPPTALITTPESLQYILVSDSLREALQEIEYVIIDEIHEIMDEERSCELSVALERLWEISGPHMRIGLSGTVENPDLVARFLAGVNRPYDIIDVSSRKEYVIELILPSLSNSAILDSDPIAHTLISYLNSLKRPVLIFVNTRDQAEYIGGLLRQKNLNVYVHHGSLSKGERESVEESLREGSVDAVIATSSLELGIDIGLLNYVIQLSSPRQVIRLIQRVGRSGHRENVASRGFVFPMLNLFDIAESSVIIRRAVRSSLRRNLEETRFRENPLDVLAHQIVGISMERDASREFIERIIRRTFCFRNISSSDIDEVIKFLEELRMINVENGVIRPTKKGRIYYYSTTMIVDTKKYYVIDVMSRRTIGVLDEDFVIREVREEEDIVLGGKLWRVKSVSDDKIYVEEVRGFEGRIPRWIGQQIPVESKIAREVCSMINLAVANIDKAREIWSRDAVEFVSRTIREDSSLTQNLPNDNKVLIERWYESSSASTYLFLYTCLGSRGNRALAHLLQTALRENSLRAIVGSTPYAVVLVVPEHIESKTIEVIIRNEASKSDRREYLESRIRESIEFSNDIKWYVVSVARKFGVISRDISLREAQRFAESYKNTVLWREALREIFYELIDLDTLSIFLDKIRKNKIHFTHLSRSEPSILAKASLEILAGYNVVRRYESLPTEMLVEIVRRRLDEKEIELICLVCGFSYTRRLREITDPVKCERCGSVLLGLNKYRDERARSLVKRILRNPDILKKNFLSDDERELIDFLRESAELIASNGKRALYTLAGTGVGIDTAIKILRRSRSYEELFTNIIEAEKKYFKTRDLWRD